MLPIDGRPLGVTASIGVAPFGGDGRTGEELLADADRAMYLAKDGGRDRAATVTATTTASGAPRRGSAGSTGSARRSSTTCSSSTASRSWTCAAARSPSTSCCCGWPTATASRSPPAPFLGVAERLGLIHAIDRWVVDEALELLAERPELRLEVNLSALSLDDRQLLDVIRGGLVRGGVDAGAADLRDHRDRGDRQHDEVARRFARALHELGCGFALDDFGTGFGSFHYLKHLPAEYLKIDGDFVRHPRSRTDELVIESIVRIAQGLDKLTIAESVEDAATLEALRAVGVDYAQGFHVGRPAAGERAARGRAA